MALPPKPTLGEKPPPTPMTVPLMLALILASFVIAVLSLLTLGFAGVILGIVLLMGAFIAIQYVLWGWWLGSIIERRDREQQDRE